MLVPAHAAAQDPLLPPCEDTIYTNASDPDVEYEVCFSKASTTADTTILDRIAERIKSASVPTATIHVAAFALGYDKIVKELRRAAFAGATVRVLMNDDGTGYGELNAPTDVVAEEEQIGATGGGESEDGSTFLIACDTGCTADDSDPIGGGLVMHNKVVLIKVDDKTEVITGSANFTDKSSLHHNDMVFIRNNDELYKFYLRYWKVLDDNDDNWVDSKNNRVSETSEYHMTESERVEVTGYDAVKGYVFERDDTDPLLDVLNNVGSCPSGTDEQKVWIANGGVRRQPVVDRLLALQDKGCRVMVVIDDEQHAHELTAAGLTSVRYDTKLHHKFMVIRARDNSGNLLNRVFTGSHRITVSALHENDENFVRIGHPGVVDRYIARFKGLYY